MVKIIFNEHKSRYGSTRIFHELKARGIPCTRAKIAEVMNDMNHNKQVAPNLLAQDFSATGPNQKWVSDITYIQLAKGGCTSVYLSIYSLDQ